MSSPPGRSPRGAVHSEPGPVGVEEGHENLLAFQGRQRRSVGLTHSGRRADGFDEVVHLPRPETAVVHRQDHDFGGRRHGLAGGLKHQGRRRQGAMDAFCPVVYRGAPHAVVDADRRRDVATGLAKVAESLRRIDGSGVRVQVGFSTIGRSTFRKIQDNRAAKLSPATSSNTDRQPTDSASSPATRGNTENVPMLPAMFMVLKTVATCRPPRSMVMV